MALRQKMVRKIPRPAGARGHVPVQLQYGFQPFQVPSSPPPGYYDPSIDAQVRASDRGLADVTADTERDKARLATDTGSRLAQNQQGFDRSLADTLRSFQGQAVGQGSAAQSAGVAQGGTLAAALAARTGNQDRVTTRLGQDRSSADAATNLAFTRGNEGLDTGLTRAGRENTFFGADAQQQRFFLAGQAGWSPPVAPANEYKAPSGVVYRVLKGKQGNRFQTSKGVVSKVRPV